MSGTLKKSNFLKCLTYSLVCYQFLRLIIILNHISLGGVQYVRKITELSFYLSASLGEKASKNKFFSLGNQLSLLSKSVPHNTSIAIFVKKMSLLFVFCLYLKLRNMDTIDKYKSDVICLHT